MKKLVYLIAVICFVFVSCKKNDDNTQTNQSVNKYRVKRLYGTTKVLGDVQYLFYYNTKNKLDSVWICDMNEDIAKRDTCGRISSYVTKLSDGNSTLKKDFIAYLEYNYLLKIDDDSVQRIKQMYPNTYADTLKKRRASVLIGQTYTENTTIIKNDKINFFVPRVDQGKGDNFKYSYLKSQFINSRYEYDNKGNVVVTRQMVDDYVLDDKNTDYVTTTYKTEYQYSNNKVVSARHYKNRFETDDDKSSWEEITNYTYSYNGDMLIGVTGKDFTLSRSGNRVTVTENGASTIYELNNEDYPIKITYPDGTYFNVEYENGAGNYGVISSSIYRKMLGIPYIK